MIFMSEKQQFPTYDTSDEICYFQSLNSCSMTDLTTSSTVYLSVYFYEAANFTVLAELVQVQPVTIGKSYSVSFQDVSTGLVSFTIDESYDEVLVVLEYLNYYLGETYTMVESRDYVPSDGKYDRAAVPLGAFRKAIKLSSSEINSNSTYYLLLAGESQVNLKLTVRGYYSDERTMAMNSSIFDLVATTTTYSMGFPFTAGAPTNGLVIRMRQLSGYGSILVNYCSSLNFTFEDMNGENGQLLITPAERQACLNYMEEEGSLLVENIVIQAVPYYGYMGVSLALYESNSSDLTVQVGELEYGLVQANTTQKYRLSVYEAENVNVSLTTYTYSGEPVFLLSKCTIFGCTPILNGDMHF